MILPDEIAKQLLKVDDIQIPKIDYSSLTIPAPEFEEIRDFNQADYTYEIIMDRIKEFEETLDDEHEIALRLASFGQSVTLSVTDIGYSNPSTLVFYGLIGDQPATLIQHVSQLNFLLMAVKKAEPDKPARRIGFVMPNDD